MVRTLRRILPWAAGAAAFLALRSPVRAELVVFDDGRVVKAEGYQIYDDELEIRLPGGGSYRVDLALVDRIVDDEVVVEAVRLDDHALPATSYDLSYAPGRKPLFGTAYDDLIEREAKRSNLDASFVSALIRAESNYEPRAVSRKGARGLMQLMPEVAAELGVRDLHDPKQNIDAGTRELSRLLLAYRGDLVRSLAAYNAGEAAVDKYAGVPPYVETQLYVHKALAAYRGKSDLGGGFGIPPAETFRGRAAGSGRSVQWTRDARTNRVVLTTKSAPRRLG